jgi:hypothetical protein
MIDPLVTVRRNPAAQSSSSADYDHAEAVSPLTIDCDVRQTSLAIAFAERREVFVGQPNGHGALSHGRRDPLG